jgi:hypothetical protein
MKLFGEVLIDTMLGILLLFPVLAIISFIIKRKVGQ